MSFLKKLKSILSWLGGAVVLIVSALFGVLWFRKRATAPSAAPQAASDDVAAAGEKTLAAIQQAADASLEKVEVEHVAAVQDLDQKLSQQANGLSADPAALAEALKRHARE